MICLVVEGEVLEVVVITKELEEGVSLVPVSCYVGSICITSDIYEAVREVIRNLIKSSLKRGKTANKLVFLTSCREVYIGVYCRLIARDIKNNGSNSAGVCFKYSNEWIQRCSPAGHSTTMSSVSH